MLTDVLFVPVLAAYLAILVALFAHGLNFLFLAGTAIRTSTRRPASTTPGSWPMVTVQLPIFNERYVAERLVDAAARLDYPRDRLEILVLDDSTDATVDIVAAAVDRWSLHGTSIRHVRRTHRSGFKAGALSAGLTLARGEFVAVFDADFVPRPDFLRRTVPVLVADPGLAFVQARWGHTNRGYSLLTRLQALAIDGHFAVEQAGRWAAGLWFNFNGTAGVWRRTALVDAGGWETDTLTEDLDISYRAFLAGWRAAYVRDVEAPAELPVSFNAYRRQQHRWARGSFECAIKHLPAVWHSRASIGRKVSATLHLTGYSIHLLLLGLSLLYPLLLIVAARYPVVFSLFGIMSLFNLTTLAPSLLFTVGQRQLGRRWAAEIPSIALLSALGAGMMVNTARAAWQAIDGRPATFERTPKFGVRRSRDDWRRLRYQLGIDRIVVIELILAGVDAATCRLALERGSWAIALYAGIFAAGLGTAVVLTIGQTVRVRWAGRARGSPVVGEPRATPG